MSCQDCDRFKRRIVQLEKLLSGGENSAIIPLRRGSSRTYKYGGCIIKFIEERGQWVCIFENKEIGCALNLSQAYKDIRDWRLIQGNPVSVPSRWVGNCQPRSYGGSIMERKDGVWLIDGERTELLSQQAVRDFIKARKMQAS